MSTAAELLAVALLLVSLAAAIMRPLRLSEAAVAVPAAGIVVALGIVPARAALDTIRAIGPSVGFLAAILAFAHLLARHGVFDYLGALAGPAARRGPRRLLTVVVGLAATITATLTLDATVILLTPVVVAVTTATRTPARPDLYACARLANSGSLLLPVSNLTNLLAFGATGLSFGQFTALMTLPWLLMVLAERLGLGWFFRRDLAPRPAPEPIARPAAPRFALIVLGGTVAALVVTVSVHVAAAWPALGGALVLLAGLLRRDGRASFVGAVRAANVGFCAFVLALAVVVDGVTRHGLGRLLRDLVPGGDGLLTMLVVALVAAALANLVNNLPATLALIPVVAGRPGIALAMLVGVNVGPNATYVGSLATLLWRRSLPAEHRPRAAEFHRLGLISVPPLLLLATVGVWCGVRLGLA